MEPSDRKPDYRAFLLRCWETRVAEEPAGSAWRFSIEDPHTGMRRNFAGLESLFDGLWSELTGGEADESEATVSGGPGRDD